MQSKEVKGLYMNEQGFFNLQVPKKFRSVTLDDCDLQDPALIEYARSWAKNPESVILMGDVGRGKTQFAFAMIREMFRKCPRLIWPRYFTSTDLDMIMLEASREDSGGRFTLHDIATQDLLFIDDFGRESDTMRAKRQYFEMLNMRYAEELPTIISTNLSLKEISDHMSKAIASRFQESMILKFTRGDLRSQRKLG